ncbi:MAG: peroxisomal hydratase-dehydrogenase-epimerase [Trebouxia sp. A1-2]|nr:MAG: peroxisomal hydratase-dehydrogenase-epimerase [Trebouxia sp. A1-2]
MLLHGEQYVEVFCPLPINGKFVVKPSLVDIQDKGKAALVITRASIVDPDTSKVYAINDVTAFVRNSGGFGRTKPVAQIAAATAVNKPPQRSPDAVIEEQTSPDLAALYRLNADYNPLHIDPAFSSKGGFEAQFAMYVFPGETLRTEMWQEGPDKVIFQTRVLERDVLAITKAAAELTSPSTSKL